MEQLLHTSLPAVLVGVGGGLGDGLGCGTGDDPDGGGGIVTAVSGSEVRQYSTYTSLHDFYFISLLNTLF